MSHRFSRRTDWDTSESEWARILRERRENGLPVLDLTASNPTRCGFTYDAAAILNALGDPVALDYDPAPRGMLLAREAVSRYYADHRAEVDPGQILLTTSTSEAYSYLFRLLCDAGDETLIAQPSYPLFDFLADIDDVKLVRYPLFHDYGWHFDLEGLRRSIGLRSRAIVLVHPNNPTGHFCKAAERAAIEEICAEHQLALIVDEVFLDYPLREMPEPDRRSFAAGAHMVLTFVLSGLSKIAGLPQMKAAWVACLGPQEALSGAMQRLEVIADSFLSMNAPVQCAIPVWLAERAGMQAQIRARISANLAALDAALAGQTATSRLHAEAGWYAVLRIPAYDDEGVAIELLRRGIALHSGHFFGFNGNGWLVVSLLSNPGDLAHGMKEIVEYFQAMV